MRVGLRVVIAGSLSSAFLGSCFWTGVAHPAAPASVAHAPAARTFTLTYAATVTDLPPTAHQVRVWMPLAKSRANQRILSREVHADVPYELHTEPVFGDDILYLRLQPPVPPRIAVTVDYTVKVAGGAAEPGSRAHAVPKLSAKDESLALRNEPYMVINETVTRLAQETVAGQPNELEKARAIYQYVLAHMSYDKTTPGWGHGDTMRACQLGKGNCTDFHSLFISMARSVGIPAQFVIGAPIPDASEGDIPGYHCWAEIYTPQAGWVPVDASEAWKHPERREYYFGTRDPARILISVGRNIQLVPAQDGPAVNMFVYPYVEVDGTPFGAVETRFHFHNREKQEA